MDDMERDETDPLLPKHPTASRQQNRDESSNQETPRSSSSTQNNLPPGHPTSTNPPSSTHESSNTEPLSPEELYTLLGIPSPTTSQIPTHPPSTQGFYNQLLQKDHSITRQYHLYDIFIITLMLLQLCISAVFIILGSLRNLDSHIAVAALGAVSTVIAGVLALLKGQGLPNRLRVERDGLRRVIFETEELYWDGRAGREVAYGDVERLRGMYLRVLDDAGRNHPDVWTAGVGSGGRVRAARVQGATVPGEGVKM